MERRPRRRPGQPSFSSTLLDAICDAMDEQPGGPRRTADTASERAVAAAAAWEQRQEALHCYYYYKPSLAASHRAARVPGADNCHGRGYFSSSEVEYSLRRLRPIRTTGAGSGAAAAPQAEKQQQQQSATEKTRRARETANGSARDGCRRPASHGARLASLLNAIFTGKRHSARQHTAPLEDEPVCSTAPSTARPRLAKTQPSARAPLRTSRSQSRTVRFLDIDGEVAVAAAAAGCRQIPVVEVEEELFRPSDSDVGEESSDASSDLFELENLAAVDRADGGGAHRRACVDELPVYGTTRVGLRRDIGRRRPFGYDSLGRSYSKVV